VTGDPFRVLGLTPGPDLTDDDVRAAWRRIAAATHPDRADGGDPPAFAAAASAYTDLRTPFGRNEWLAELTAPPRRPRRVLAAPTAIMGWAGRVRDGRPGRLALRVLAAAAFSGLVIVVAGWRPATPALIVGAVTWLVRTGRNDVRRGGPGG
jgi:hypothetical protein